MQPTLWASRKIGASFFNGGTSWVVFLMAAEQVTKMLLIEDGDMIHVISAKRADGCRPTSGFNPVGPPGEVAAYSARRKLKLKTKMFVGGAGRVWGACRPSGPRLIEAASFCETARHRGELMAAKTVGASFKLARRNEAQVQAGGRGDVCLHVSRSAQPSPTTTVQSWRGRRLSRFDASENGDASTRSCRTVPAGQSSSRPGADLSLFKTYLTLGVPSGVRVVRVRKKELLAVGLVSSGGVLAFRRDWPVDELPAKTRSDTWILGGIYQYHSVLVEQTLFAFDLDRSPSLFLRPTKFCDPAARNYKKAVASELIPIEVRRAGELVAFALELSTYTKAHLAIEL
jgi:hypothetical protein